MPLQQGCPKWLCFLTEPLTFSSLNPFCSHTPIPSPNCPHRPAPQAHSSSGSPAILWTVQSLSLAPHSLKVVQILENRTQNLHYSALPCSKPDFPNSLGPVNPPAPSLKCHPQCMLRGKSQPNSEHLVHRRPVSLNTCHISMCALLPRFLFPPTGRVSPH